MVLRRLEPRDQGEGFGAVLDGQCQHLQARLAPLQGVAALVRQPGDHLADGRQPLGLHGALLSLLDRGDVLADGQHGRTPLVVDQEPGVPDHPAARAVAADDRVLVAVHLLAGHDAGERRPDCGVVRFGDEQGEIVAALDLLRGVAGEALGVGAEVEDRPVGAEDDDHAFGRLDEVAEGGLAPLLRQGQPPALGDPRQTARRASMLSGLRM